MEEELYNIFLNCYEETMNGKNYKINIPLIINTIYKYKKNKKLKEFVIVNDKMDENKLAIYNPNYKNICVFDNRLIKSGKNNSSTNCSEILMVLYEFVQVLLHEVEHSKQYSLVYNLFDKSLEKELIKLTSVFDNKMLDKILKSNLKYTHEKINKEEFKRRHNELFEIWDEAYKNVFYEKILIERLAEYVSFTTLANIFKDKSNFEYFHTLSLAYLKNIMLKGYKLEAMTIKSPTINTIEYFKDKGFYHNIDAQWYSENNEECLKNVSDLYDYDIRYKYGLPITVEEYKNEVEEVRKINKKLKKKFYVSIKFHK